MKAKVIKIGNSKGIRIPKVLLDEAGLQEEVELEASGGSIVIRPAKAPRSGWSDSFRAMAEHGDDRQIDRGVRTRWEDSEWEWK